MSAIPARILVAGSDLLAGALASALETYGFATKYVAANPPKIRRALGWDPNMVLIDVRSLDMLTASTLVEELSGTNRPVCVIDTKDDETRWAEWRSAAPSALIDRNEPLDQLFATLTRLLRIGHPQPIVPGSAAALDAPPVTRPERDPRLQLFGTLTERETVVLGELMEGHCAEEIAKAGFVSISTVRSQVKSILQKLGVNSQLAAVALARRAGWSLDNSGKSPPKAVNGRRRRVS